MIILSFETSCDETSVAVTKNGKEVLSNVVLSQIDIHKKYGGVVPEIASRNHIAFITTVIEEAIENAKIKVSDIDLVAITEGPGLIGSLLIGINAALAFAYANNIKVIGVNHLIGHIYASNIEHDIEFPALALLVSGGHTELVYMEEHLSFLILGSTLDDAVGEAYDKVGRVVNLPYPGGPAIDKLAAIGRDTYKLPRPYLADKGYDFSFSGLKSAVINLVHNKKQKGETVDVNDLCASFQESVIDVFMYKIKKALEEYKVKNIIIAGGVAANKGLRKRIYEEIKDTKILIPSMQYCTDNAAMIGCAAYYLFLKHGANKDYVLGAISTLDLG
ncbi:tRNA (adenosine(37)-N6)-threonylcarbamoyltransferase complex transferase subunit TsaD [Acholeplasma sp. OttesenSCG-928-E16]|nr:tRNA (adenosine(37)-N6)-threonylcarbamoyltransferase complex transferase subunit TsaD [Acholeplasma sp. OttesenSCG-928-E16]